MGQRVDDGVVRVVQPTLGLGLRTLQPLGKEGDEGRVENPLDQR
jgi:hypothetical protein